MCSNCWRDITSALCVGAQAKNNLQIISAIRRCFARVYFTKEPFPIAFTLINRINWYRVRQLPIRGCGLGLAAIQLIRAVGSSSEQVDFRGQGQVLV